MPDSKRTEIRPASTGTEANITKSTAVGYAGELAVATDTEIVFAAATDGGAMYPVVERWRADQTTNTSPTDDTSAKKVTIQYLPGGIPSNAYFVRFQVSMAGVPTDTDFYLVLEDA